MAITNSDGSIILSTAVDTSGIKKGMSTVKNDVSSITKAFKSFAAAVGLAFSVTKLVQFSKESANVATQTEASVQRLVDIYGDATGEISKFIDAQSAALGLSKASAASFASVYGNLFSTWADQSTNAQLTAHYLNATAVVASKTGRTMEDVQERIRSGLLGNTEAVEDLGIFVNVKTIEMTEAFQKVADGRTWEQLNNAEQNQVRTLAILEQATKKYGNEVADTTALTKSKFTAAFEDFKNTWGQVVNLVLVPVLEMLTKIFTTATFMINSFMGKTGTIEESTSAISDNISSAVENQSDLTKEVKKTGKELKKTLAGFDDLQIITSNSGTSASGLNLDGGAGNITGGFGDIGSASVDGSAYLEETSRILIGIMGIVAVALTAVGLILLFTGNIVGGVGYIIAGAALFGITMASASVFEYDHIIQALTTIMGIAGGALLALGIILLWIGGVVAAPVAIGMIIAGGLLIVSAVTSQAVFAPDDIDAWLSIIMGIAGGALLALGIILCMVGSVPLGVGMIIAGSVSLVSAVTLNFSSVVNMIKGPIGIIAGIAGGALLVLGIILTCTGNFPLGIPLIAAGAVGLVTSIAVNWNTIVEKLQGPIGIITAVTSTLLLVLGIILTCTGNLPLGIALIVAGAAGLVTVTALNWDGIIDWISGAWDAVKNFWNTYVAPVFTADWWLNLGKTCINGLIAGFEGGINGIIAGFETMLNWLITQFNKISFTVPEWVPGIGGNSVGVNISPASFGRVSIPRLAKGAVIPGGKEFLAMLGDQPAGQTNIETPLDTMIEAFNHALDSRGDTVKEEHYYLSETELMSIIYRLAKSGERIQGTSLVNGGIY